MSVFYYKISLTVLDIKWTSLAVFVDKVYKVSTDYLKV